MPDRRSGDDFQNTARVVAIPMGHGEFGPAHLLVFEQVGELWQAAAFFRRSSLLSARAWRRRLVEAGVEAQPGDEADMPTHGADEIERGETGVGDDDDLAFWQPSPNLEQALKKVDRLFR
jgi:hypothetical protein